MEEKLRVLTAFFSQHPKGWLRTSTHSLGEGAWKITAELWYRGAWGDQLYFGSISITGSNGTWDNDPCDLWSLLNQMGAEAKEMAEVIGC